jgi:hypothetical protein
MSRTHRTFIIIGLILIGISAFLPLGSITNAPRRLVFNPPSGFFIKQILGITSWIYYLNLLLLAIPFVCGYHGQGILSRILVILFGITALFCTSFFSLLIGFSWTEHIRGNIGIGVITVLLGDLAIIIGCLFQISYNKKLDQELESNHE